MKKIISIVLVICMCLGMVATVSAADLSFSRTLNIVRFFRAIFTKAEDSIEFGELEDGTLTLYVATNGKASANGTEKNPYATVADAVSVISALDLKKIEKIDIVVKAGVYSITEPIDIVGLSDCQISLIGEDGAKIVGGVAFSASDFVKATGDIVKYFPEADKIVMIDLTKYGYTVDEINAMIKKNDYQNNAPAFSADGVLQTLARYPNASEGWINITEGWMLDRSGNVTPYTDNDVKSSHEQYPVQTKIQYGVEHMERVQSWNNTGTIKIAARFNQLWCSDNTTLSSISEEDDTFIVPYTGGYEPLAGTVMYWYNIPEELDAPGEFYITSDGKLYYYPTESFNSAVFALPVSDGIINVNGDNVTIENIQFESSRKDGLVVNGNNISLLDCEISAIAGEFAILASGNDITISGNSIHDCREDGITIESGDLETLTRGNSLIYNNDIYDFGLTSWPYTRGIGIDGCGITVSHNDIHDSKTRAIYWEGAHHLIEYNDVHDVLTASDDIGAISSDERIHADVVIRYNYIHNIGCVGALAEIDKINPEYSYVGSAAIYGDFGGSYFKVYGNVIETVNGNGLWLFGRGIEVHGNLIIDCSSWYLGIFASQWNDIYKYDKISPKYKAPEYIFSDVWKEANPDLASLKFDLTDVPSDDPLGWAMPGAIVIKNNWVHYNKSVRDFSNWGAAPYSIQEEVFAFCSENIDINVGARANNNMSLYNSRRETVDLEKLINETASGYIEIDWATFQTIGCIEE